MKALGSWLKEAREAKKKDDPKFSLRQLAERVRVTPGYLSQVENGKESPANGTLKALAEELDQEYSVLLILAGRLSNDLQEIVSQRPALFTQLIRQLRDAPDDAILRVVREVRDGDW